jgi:hypothetical protein
VPVLSFSLYRCCRLSFFLADVSLSLSRPYNPFTHKQTFKTMALKRGTPDTCSHESSRKRLVCIQHDVSMDARVYFNTWHGDEEEIQRVRYSHGTVTCQRFCPRSNLSPKTPLFTPSHLNTCMLKRLQALFYI